MKYFMYIKKLLPMLLLLLALSLGLSSCDFSGISNTTEGGNTETPENPGNPDDDPETPEEGGETEETQTVTYEEYLDFTADEQKAFIDSFVDYYEFFAWHAEAKAKYDEEHKAPEIDGDIDLGDLLGPQE
jgi:hypothetical protein